jgi:2-oxoglutarate dehydrogenase E2 component (dihydrolipoamide succinyltransferase)
MAVEIKVPSLGESVTEATVGKWFKAAGDAVKVDEPLCELETDKVTVEVPSPVSGVLAEIKVAEGTTVAVGAVLGSVKEGAAATSSQPAAKSETPAAKPQPATASKEQTAAARPVEASARGATNGDMPPSPSARKMMEESGIAVGDVQGSGRRGQVLKEDVATAVSTRSSTPAASQSTTPAVSSIQVPVTTQQMRAPSLPNDAAREERVKMTRLRQTIARRLKDAQNTAAMLTTFNDVDMSEVMRLRSEYKDLFEKRHGMKLGFMGFFVRACLTALKEIPAVNAEIDGGDLVYKNYYHIGVAVGTDRGLVVPVVREADRMSLAEIEATIADFGKRARDGKLGIEEMQGGTFTISNGGVYGSMLSTPILNAPQSGILGMHRIEERPVARNGQVVIKPMMYLALSYDHRIVDGREAVTFLVRVKECLEDPRRFLLDV